MKEVIGKKLMNMLILLKQDYISQFRNIRVKNVTNVIKGLFNVNSLASKFDEFKLVVSGIFEILTITET